MKKDRNFWTKEKCREEALKYKTREEFREKSRYAYVTSFKNQWLDDICSHLQISNIKPIGYWSKEKCREESLKYKNRNDFRINNRSAYAACLRHNWLNDVCIHMSGVIYKSHGYWNKENCKEESLKYETRLEFQVGSRWAYRTALKNDWMDDICSHMKSFGNRIKRCIYVYEFSDNYAYIGLTYNIEKRNSLHQRSGSVYNYLKMNPSYELKILTNFVNIEEAKKLENKYVKEYKKNGWKILNKIKTGGIGGSKFWTKEKCQNIASECKTINEFYKTKAYKPSKKYGWFDEITKNLAYTTKPPGYWTKEKCREEALKFSRRRDFSKNFPVAYNICIRNKWLDDICSHTNEMGKKPNGYWTKEICQEEALKYNNRSDFRKLSLNHYSASVRNKWINDICHHMTLNKKPNGYWNKEKCLEESSKYDRISKFKKEFPSAYGSVIRNGWLEEVRKIINYTH